MKATRITNQNEAPYAPDKTRRSSRGAELVKGVDGLNESAYRKVAVAQRKKGILIKVKAEA